MAHRCTYGEQILEVYVGKVNSDSNEGRGRMLDHSVWDNHRDAQAAVKGLGVCGVGDGDVYVRRMFKCDADDTGEKCSRIPVTESRIYSGAVANSGVARGEFCKDGWAEFYSPLLNNPEYQQYLRLRKKFEND